MVKHIVMYKLKDPTLQNAEALRDKFMSMQGKIDVLREIWSGVDVLRSQRSFDVVLVCKFDSMDDMEGRLCRIVKQRKAFVANAQK